MEDEYTSSWSDAVATEAAFLALECDAEALGDPRQYGTLGKLLWWQRCLGRIDKLRSEAGDRPSR